MDQLFIGSMIAINTILWFDKPLFERFYEVLEQRSVLISYLLSAFYFCFGVGFLFLNHELREDYSFLKYYSKCPACKGSMVVSQSLNMAICQIVPGALLYYPYATKKTLQTDYESYRAFLKVKHRLGVFFVLVIMIPSIFFAVSQLVVGYLFTGIYKLSSLFYLLYLGPLAFYVGMAMSYFNEVMYTRFGLDVLLQPLVVQDTEIKHRSTFSSPDAVSTEDKDEDTPKTQDQ